MNKLKTICLLLSIFLFACNPSHRIKKIATKNDLLKKELKIIKDTTIIEGAKLRMNISPYQFTRIDSYPVFTETERIRVSIQKIRDTILINAECLPDTIIKTIPIIEEKIIIEEKKRGVPWGLLSLIALIVGVAYIIKVMIP